LRSASTPVNDVSVLDIQADPVPDIEAVTDRGARIPLFSIQFLTPASKVQNFVNELEAQQTEIVRLAELGPECNCHGWVFTASQFSLRDFDIPVILRDNGYQETEQPASGDIIVYYNDQGIAHSGLVQSVAEDGQVVVESKWGPFGLYQHAPLDQPYATEFRYYHTNRGTHVLRFHWQVTIAHARQ
jgi:hypothetical protein